MIRRRTIQLLTAACMVVSLTTCMEESIVPNGAWTDVPEGMVRLTLYTNAADYSIPVTRGQADEEGVDDPMVLVFDGMGDTATFTEAAQSEVAGSETTVILTKTSQAATILLIANAPENKFYDGTNEAAFTADNITAAMAGRTLAEVEEVLLTVALDNPQSVAPFTSPQTKLPVSGITVVTEIDENTQLGTSASELLLTRSVAKASVTVAAGLDGFTLHGAGIANAPLNGSFYRNGITIQGNTSNTTHYLTASSGDGVSGMAAAVGNTTSATPLYLYEAETTLGTALIVKGTYNGTEYYYKLAFRYQGNELEIERNKDYKFTITGAASGYTTMQEAIDGALSNTPITYDIEVTDAMSHEIVSNGHYYLGVSNSTVLIYGDQTTLNEAFVVTTDATAAMKVSPGVIAITSGYGLTLSETTIALGGSTTVNVEMPESTSTASVTVQVGNLTKTVDFIRYPNFDFGGFTRLPYTDYVNCEMEPGTGEWFKLMGADYKRFTGDKTFTHGQWLCIAADPHLSNDGTEIREAVFYTARGSSGGRSKIYVRQPSDNIHKIFHTVPDNGYVGAFWRADQSGERLIRIPYTDVIKGDWIATVIEGEDWIILDTEKSADPGVTWNESTENPQDMMLYDAVYQLSGDDTSVAGTVEDSSDELYFRIGLRSTISANNSPRYGVILVSVTHEHTTIYWRIFVRQDEQDDYLMRPEDPQEDGTGFGTPNRPHAVKISVFNLTAQDYMDNPDYMTSAGTSISAHKALDIQGGAFTLYPTQAGAFFSWATTTTGVMRRAWHPSIPNSGTQISSFPTGYSSSTWPSLEATHETCPVGYRRPMDHTTLTSVVTSVDPADSELRQSLFSTPPGNSSVSAQATMYGGYYADGFFDRRAIRNENSTNTAEPNNAVEIATTYVGYAGVVFYNQFNNASLFFPFTGYRDQRGILSIPGTQASYWTVTASGTYTSWHLNLVWSNLTNYNNQATVNFNSNYRYMAYPIRCVVAE